MEPTKYIDTHSNASPGVKRGMRRSQHGLGLARFICWLILTIDLSAQKIQGVNLGRLIQKFGQKFIHLVDGVCVVELAIAGFL